MLGRFARTLAVLSVAVTLSGCCTALNGFCDCVGCLLNGPRIPFLADPEQTAAGEDTAPTATAASTSMPY